MAFNQIFDRLIANIGKNQYIIALGFDMKESVQIGGHTLVAAFYLDGNARQGRRGFLFVENLSFYRNLIIRLLAFLFCFIENDMFVLYLVTDVFVC